MSTLVLEPIVEVQPKRTFKKVNGCLCVADASTPQADQRYGYKLVVLS